MAASGADGLTPEIRAVASSLLLEAAAAEVVTALRRLGRSSLLLKGVTTERWLYAGDPRAYGDVDLLVDPAGFAECECVLQGIGFERSPLERMLVVGRPTHASTWIRAPIAVDLHKTVIGAAVSAEKVWSVLREHAETWSIGGVELQVLDTPARALILALHMAQHGPGFARTSEDMARAIATLPTAAWVEAANIAATLEARPSMAAGLLALEGGRGLCETLGLRLEGALTVEGSMGFHVAQGLDWFIATKGVLPRAELVREKLFPPPSVVRGRVPWSRSGRAALFLAYGIRLVRLGSRLPGAILAVRAVRAARVRGREDDL